MAMPHGTPTTKHVIRPICKSAQPLENGRRSMLSLLLLSSMPTTMISEANDSKKTLFEEYLRRSRENKQKNDKERLDDYYRRNYKDYFELIEGTVKDKQEELLSESEKQIREWLKKNK
ncbi:uncharacterized protein LOC120277928 [Dioscorea cayenensis subsp. rotundata]|uniref:Uncharacterized protein LOC120277928 n=1 Tax=Dioscorea cayennensis subsp. rotundata TaxID=55577 RepID=A0AB40CKY4_DIOCR|nr:uncharacterized protein LOC120277928 [Dioscorea cayenensis subsp. rotundata]